VRDRRSYGQRRALVRRILDEVFSHHTFALAVVDCARLFGVPPAVCDRILHELERVGIVQQARPGVWTAGRHVFSSWRCPGA
jgi:hypothetical protein